MFFGNKKEKDINVFTESGIQQKLYGYLRKDKKAEEKKILREQKDITPVLQTQEDRKVLNREMPNKEEKTEKEVALPKKEVQSYADISAKLAKSEKLPKKDENIHLKNNHYSSPPTIRIPKTVLILILCIIFGVVILNFKNKKDKPVISKVVEQPVAAVSSVVVSDFVEQSKTPDLPKTFYAIQVCVYEKEKDAQKLVDELKQKKFNAYIYTDNAKAKTKYRVYVDKVSSKKTALETLGALSDVFKDSFVRVINE
ncbi:MAG: SPOR domain-containing protein [Candidatus Omnitrophota bacterium]